MSNHQTIWRPTGQLGIFDQPSRPIAVRKRVYRLLIWNVGHPAPERARRQADWLISQDPNVVVLTETARNEGCELLQKRLTDEGFRVLVSLPPEREYGAIIASRCPIAPSDFQRKVAYLPFRIASAVLGSVAIEVVGVYVPSRDSEPTKVERKQRFVRALVEALADAPETRGRILCGDLNVVPRSHVPRYSFFQSWEYDFLDHLTTIGFLDCFLMWDTKRQDYSWVGRTGDGYRYDYCFVTRNLNKLVLDCRFNHAARSVGLSDHSALEVKLGGLSV